MTENFMCVSIPQELSQFQKNSDVAAPIVFISWKSDVQIVKGKDGTIEHVDYWNNGTELLKQIYYEGSAISKIKYFRNNILYQEERYSENKVVSRGTYNKDKILISGVAYHYDRQERIIKIEKSRGNNTYSVDYGYDELGRVNSRIVSYNSSNIVEQKYRFDILDRVVEYKDNRQIISVDKISSKGELISYSITDKMGNVVSIVNNLIESCYIDTDITLNGHKTTKVCRSYMDNVFLKKPYTTEDDLDLVIANLFNSQHAVTKRTSDNDISQGVIKNSIEARVLPISIRKRLLYNQVVNL